MTDSLILAFSASVVTRCPGFRPIPEPGPVLGLGGASGDAGADAEDLRFPLRVAVLAAALVEGDVAHRARLQLLQG